MAGDNPEGVIIEGNPESGEVTARSADRAAPLHQPGRFLTPVLWLTIVTSFCLVMLAAAASLMLEFLSPGGTSPNVEATTILLIFTSCTGFLAGLLLPSPVQR